MYSKKQFKIDVRTIFEKYNDDNELCHMAIDSLYELVLEKAGYDIKLVEKLVDHYNVDFYNIQNGGGMDFVIFLLIIAAELVILTWLGTQILEGKDEEDGE